MTKNAPGTQRPAHCCINALYVTIFCTCRVASLLGLNTPCKASHTQTIQLKVLTFSLPKWTSAMLHVRKFVEHVSFYCRRNSCFILFYFQFESYETLIYCVWWRWEKDTKFLLKTWRKEPVWDYNTKMCGEIDWESVDWIYLVQIRTGEGLLWIV